MGDFQGVVTLGVARASKCIFPYRGARFSKWVPPHVHAHGCTWPRRCPEGQKLSGIGQALAENDPKTQKQGLAENDPKTQKLSGIGQALAENDPKTQKLSGIGKALPENHPKTQTLTRIDK